MSRRLEREIARRLQERGEVEPPADLLRRIQAEIPDSLEIGLDATAGPREVVRRPATGRTWLLAASLAAMAGAGLLAYRLFESDRELALPPRAEIAAAPTPAPVIPLPPKPAPAPQRVFPAPGSVAELQGPGAAGPAPSLKKESAFRVREAPPPVAEEKGVAGGVEGGVAGGVVGGVPGGVPGGEPAGVPAAPSVPSNTPPAPAEPSVAEAPKLSEPQPSLKAAPSSAAGSPAAADRMESAAPAPPQEKVLLAKPERSRQAPFSSRLTDLETELAAIEAGTRPRSELPELLRRARALAAERPADARAAALLSRLKRLSP